MLNHIQSNVHDAHFTLSQLFTFLIIITTVIILNFISNNTLDIIFVTFRPWARYNPRAPPPHILANLYFFEPLGCPEYEIGL